MNGETEQFIVHRSDFIDSTSVWRNLAAHVFRVHVVGGSNPPTLIKKNRAGGRAVEGRRP